MSVLEPDPGGSTTPGVRIQALDRLTDTRRDKSHFFDANGASRGSVIFRLIFRDSANTKQTRPVQRTVSLDDVARREKLALP